VPVLTIFSSIFAIMGACRRGAGFNLTIFTYIQQTMKAISIFDIVSGLIKSVVFAAAISPSAARGLQGARRSGGVGNATTSAVVTSIFLIIVIDSTFAIILHYI
jgi:phospholipid/cholesterol/gamma-HCH transport system permease protein